MCIYVIILLLYVVIYTVVSCITCVLFNKMFWCLLEG